MAEADRKVTYGFSNAAEQRPVNQQTITPLYWQDEALVLLDQRRLPNEESWLRYADVAGVVAAIREMVVRGAPAIGIAGAYGMVFAADAAWRAAGVDWRTRWQSDVQALRHARPTAVNLAWAIDLMEAYAAGLAGAPLVGASVATAMAYALGIRAIPVHHLEGHLLSPLLSEPSDRLTAGWPSQEMASNSAAIAPMPAKGSASASSFRTATVSATAAAL